MPRKMGREEFLRPEKQRLQARLEKEALCYGCHCAPMHYCVQCEVRDINKQEEATRAHVAC